jgi:F0F1-type ATP synthase assembly protein I
VKEEHGIVQEKEPEPSKPKEWVRPAWFLFTVGWYMVISVTIPTLIGYWLDKPDKFGSYPLYTIIGFICGSVLAFLGLFILLRRFYLEQKNQHNDIKGPEDN